MVWGGSWGGRMRGMHLPISHFQLCFWCIGYSFSIISNLLDSVTENVQTKCIILGEALRIRVKRCKQNLPQNTSKSTKIAITASKFSNSSGAACPLTPWSFSCLLISLKFVLPKKIRVKKKCPPFKISRYATASCHHWLGIVLKCYI